MSGRFPRQFGNYVLLKPLARGGMGEIYLAASGQIGGFEKLCVIKKVLSEKTDRAKSARFMDEAKVVLRLSHANLVSTFDAGDVEGEFYIAMELVEGKDLREIWNRCVRTRTRIPIDVALHCVREIARALAYVHTYGDLRLVHRDVAPPNILLSYFGEVKLTDFGLARSILKQEHTAPGVVFGRASYLAPEQARGEVADARTDVYSLGIVLWELLTGQPYLQLAGLDPVTSLSLVRHPNPQPPSSRAPWVAADLDAIALKALAPDRAARFRSAEEMRRALSDVMTRVAPRADAERVAEFLRVLYRDIIAEERAERELLLKEKLPTFRGERFDEPRTPPTDVIPDPQMPAGMVPPPVPAAAARVRAMSPAAPVPAELTGESLHVSAMRARASSQMPPSSPSSPSSSPLSSAPSSRGRALADESEAENSPTDIWQGDLSARAMAAGPAPGQPVGPGAAAPETFVGRIIDNRYQIHRKIGEGGMGTVYAGEHVEIGKGVAVKILHPLYSGQQQLVERFRREARAASRVGHPNIVDVTDFGTTEEGCAYFVMEQLEGMDLADVLLHEGPLDPSRAVRIAVQVCRALQAAHAQGIIHRDLKPENIFLVARDGQADFVKVLDFGIARSVSGGSRRLTSPGMAMGTPEYMAPEQALGRVADRRTDVYAVGALIYEMVVGKAPYADAPPNEILERKSRVPDAPSAIGANVPAVLDAVILQALDPQPDRRPQTMAQLEYELTKVMWGRTQAVAEMLGLRVQGTPGAAGRERAADDPNGAGAGQAGAEEGLSPPPGPPLLAPSLSGEIGDMAGMSFDDVGLRAPAAPRRDRPGSMGLRLAAALGVAMVVGGTGFWFARHKVAELGRRDRARGTVAASSPGSRPLAERVPVAPPPLAGARPSPTPSSLPSSWSPTAGGQPPARPAQGIPPSAALIKPLAGPADRAAPSGTTDQTIVALRSEVARGNQSARPALAEALVDSGWKALAVNRRDTAIRRAREALAHGDSTNGSHGAHALLAEALLAARDFNGALDHFSRALSESPGDIRLKRRVFRVRRALAVRRAAPADPRPAPPAVAAPSAGASAAAGALATEPAASAAPAAGPGSAAGETEKEGSPAAAAAPSRPPRDDDKPAPSPVPPDPALDQNDRDKQKDSEKQ